MKKNKIMSKYRLKREKWGVCEDWVYPQKRIFSFLGIINIWSNVDSEGVPINKSTYSTHRYWGGYEREEHKAINFINRLHKSSRIIYKR